MDSKFWHQCWERNMLGFHQRDVHPFLISYFNKFILPSDKHIFVPLCGKTHDMAYLANIMQVTGNELSDIACRDFFNENKISFEKYLANELTYYVSPKLSLIQGDFFKLAAHTLNSVDWIYDRAALIALPVDMQKDYVEHLKSFFNANTRLFLITLEYPQGQLNGPPFPVTPKDVVHLFSGFNVVCIAENELEDKQFAQRSFAVDYLIEKLYVISLV